ncbi:uncharacterized protein LOC119675021 [Teleopsis dalmanni]|uniref:uncharacterized protein LOC119675021 n=1 Tax=Teleopsis dalmanni TaxID=139649 RepID=UPI0018CF5BB2|nr:uncharacterized protein LOC119675021 [Teleopsis dalmanni]
MKIIKCNLENAENDKEIRRQKNLEKDRRYRLKNLEKIREAKRARYAANKEKAKAKRDANKEKTKARYESKKEIIEERSRAWYVANKEAVKEKYQKQRQLHTASNEKKLRQRRKNWTPAQEIALINFLKENVEFEKPTAQAFYKRFVQNSDLNGDWKMVRLKMYNMRRTYKNTKEWLKTIDTTMTNADEIKYAVCSKFRFYYEFEKIFGSNTLNLFQYAKLNSETISDQTSNEASITIDKTDNAAFKIYYNKMPSRSHDRSSFVSETLLSRTGNELIKNIQCNFSTTCCSEACLRSVVSGMAQYQADIFTLGKEKFNYDAIVREKQIQLLSRKVSIQEKELDLMKGDLSNQEHLKILELEKKEETAMIELELKYKN